MKNLFGSGRSSWPSLHSPLRRRPRSSLPNHDEQQQRTNQILQPGEVEAQSRHGVRDSLPNQQDVPRLQVYVPAIEALSSSAETEDRVFQPFDDSDLPESDSSKPSDEYLHEKRPEQASTSGSGVKRDGQVSPTGFLLTEDGIDERIWLAHVAKEHQEAMKDASKPVLGSDESTPAANAVQIDPTPEETLRVGKGLRPIFLFDHLCWPDMLAMVLGVDVHEDEIWKRMLPAYVTGMQRWERPDWGDCVIVEGHPQETIVGWIFFPWEPEQREAVFGFMDYSYQTKGVLCHTPIATEDENVRPETFEATTIMYRSDFEALGDFVATAPGVASVQSLLWYDFGRWSEDNRIWSIAPEDPDSLEPAEPISRMRTIQG